MYKGKSSQDTELNGCEGKGEKENTRPVYTVSLSEAIMTPSSAALFINKINPLFRYSSIPSEVQSMYCEMGPGRRGPDHE